MYSARWLFFGVELVVVETAVLSLAEYVRSQMTGLSEGGVTWFRAFTWRKSLGSMSRLSS